MTPEHTARLTQLIADKLATGLYHPGDGVEQASTTLMLPMFKTTGMPPEVGKQVNLTVKLIAEAIIYLIQTDGQSDIIPKDRNAQ